MDNPDDQILPDHNVNGISVAYAYIYINSNNSPVSISDSDTNRRNGCKAQLTLTSEIRYQRNGNVISTFHPVVLTKICILSSVKIYALRKNTLITINQQI